jgi:antitoxin ParD1/3/4
MNANRKIRVVQERLVAHVAASLGPITQNSKNCYHRSMNVSLTPQLEALVNAKVKNGMYQTASEVIREGLRLLKERDEEKQKRLREDVLAGFDEIARGNYIDVDEKGLKKFFADVKTRGRKRLLAERKRKAS